MSARRTARCLRSVVPLAEPHTSITLSFNEPYASGVAPVAARISREGKPIRLALGFSAAGQTALLVLDEQGRIVEETSISGKHLVRHRFVYDEHD